MKQRQGPLEFRVVSVTRRNVASLLNAWDDVFDNPVELTKARACLSSPGYRLFAAIAAGKVIGQIRGFIQLQPDDDPWLYIDNLGVSEGWKRKGVASALLERLVGWGRKRGARLVWLGSEPDNEEATGFYQSAGFSAEPMLTWSKPLHRKGSVD
jgi:ribosomal protein S18 acetylase RimI-like enzyme